MSDSAPKQIPPYGLRMPPDLKDRVQAAAVANNRSMNAEIVATLEEKYPAPRGREDQFRVVMSLIDDLRKAANVSAESKRSQLRLLYVLLMNIAGDLPDDTYDALTIGWDEPPEFNDPDFIMSAIDPEATAQTLTPSDDD